MIIEDQSDVIAWLARQSKQPNAPDTERIETHISEIFLTGDRAYKLKRAVKLPYADFSTPQIRLRACEKELALNAATSPEIYIRVRRITRDGTELAFDGSGELVDSVVEMHRFKQERILDQMALDGQLTSEIMSVLAREIAVSHANALVVQQDGVANIENILDINRAGFGQSGVFSETEIEHIDQKFRAGLQNLAPILKQRADRGCIKRCHGDLHLRNICMFNRRPQLFDCIDFNDELATVDVLYDIAFLAMDLWHRDMRDFASLVVNQYLDRSNEEDGYACFPYFIALRAAVRAHVLATQAQDATSDEAAETIREARSYHDLALSLLEPQQARLIAIGGLSGSGKSTVATKIAPLVGPAPGARMIESDRTRKAMFNVEPESCLPESAYTQEVSDKVYGMMSARAADLLATGCSVVADAVFDVPDRRRIIEDTATRATVPFDGIWLQADPDILKHRVETRPKTASDATGKVLRMQLSRDRGSMSWKKITTAGSVENTISETRRLLGV